MRKLRVTSVVALFLMGGVFGPAGARAGSAAIGSVAGSLNASVGGQALLANSVVFSGDLLQVKDGAAVVALQRGSRMALGRDSAAVLLRDAKGVAVVLESGNVSIFHPASAEAVRVMIGKVVVTPALGYASLGAVAMLNGVIVVAAKEGSLHVAGEGRALDLAQGRSLTIRPAAAGFPQGGPAANAGTPQPGGGGSDHTWRIVELATGGTGVILSAAALSSASSSKSIANSALSAAQSAQSTAAAASSAAQAAAAAAAAATQAAAAATALAEATVTLEEASNNTLGCELNKLANELGQASPYTPPAGVSCSK